ncbi:hypothetical protein LLE70_07195 [Xanthomonas campestris pv. aberrans]|nr:hypothetical protein [Xanthomonas campestris pv. aberrans]
MRKNILWFGVRPLPGVVERLELRGFHLLENPEPSKLIDGLLAESWVAVISQDLEVPDDEFDPYKHLERLLDHGILILIVADRTSWAQIREEKLLAIDGSFNWDRVVRFIPDWTQTNFDNIVAFVPPVKWKSLRLVVENGGERLLENEERILFRAFPKADEVRISELWKGLSGARVFMVHEKRMKQEASISYWTQPRLVKIGDREEISNEVAAMRDISPFVPFELRPNLETHVEGMRKALFVADFVDKSESLYDAAWAGRAEAAISNLFSRTLGIWRQQGRKRDGVLESLATAAERLGIVSPGQILPLYSQSEAAQVAGIDVSVLWNQLKEIQFVHRAAFIHGDLHGNNVRVRGQDAILIDFGSVKGSDRRGAGAPLCFDVAMFEVALVFEYNPSDVDASFEQKKWREKVESWYEFDTIRTSGDSREEPLENDWLGGCLPRIRAYGIYEHSDAREYPLALAIAMLRLCKFPVTSPAEKGRRIYGLTTAAKIIGGAYRRGVKHES